jgi:type VI secretion system secreted protein VgrG
MNDTLNADSARAFSIAQLGPPEPVVFLHCAIFLKRNTILGAETFRLQSFQGQENVSELFEFQLELNGNTQEKGALSFGFDEIVGRPITVGIGTPTPTDETGIDFSSMTEGAVPVAPTVSLFNGIVTSFSVKNRGTYSITMKPALHRLSLTNSYRVLHNKTVWEMIASLLDAHNISYAPFAHTQHNLAVTRRQDWMQAGETDFDFLKRLLGKAFLYYYFTHTATNHAVVFSNQPRYPKVFPDGRPLYYEFTSAQPLGLTQADVVTEYCLKKTLGSTGVRGVLTLQDGAWLDNPVVQFQSFQANASPDAGPLPFHLYKSYQYGGSKDEAQVVSTATQSTIDSARHELSGNSNCANFRAAHGFTLAAGPMGTAHEREDALESRVFVLTSINHQANADGSYQNQFQASDAAFLITPYSIQETQQGSILAEVMSAATVTGQNPIDFGASTSFDTGQASFIDQMSQQVQFQQMGVYVRFSTAERDDPYVWIKLSSSMQTAPTIGSIVSVSRAQDESELPEIQNVIQSNGTTLVVPSGWLSNTRIGNNYSTSYGDNQNISYGKYSIPNLQQASGIVKAGYSTGRFGNASFSQGAGYSFSAAESAAPGAESNSSELYGSDPVASDILSASESFGSTYSRQIGDMSYSHSHIEKSIGNSWTDTSESISYVGNSVSVSTGLTSTSTSTLAASTTNTNIGVSTNFTTTGQTFNTSISGDVVETSTTGNTIRDTVNGNLIETSVSGNTVRTSTTGNLEETSFTGDTIRTSTSGDLEETLTTGVTIRNITTGETTENRIGCGETYSYVNGEVVEDKTSAAVTVIISLGDSTRIETSGATSNIVTMAETTTVETAGPGARVSNSDETPHVDNIVTRILMIEATIIFM